MLKKNITILISAVIACTLLACELPKKDAGFQSEFSDVNFGQINLIKMPSDHDGGTYYYEMIRLIIRNDMQSSLYINDGQNISGMVFDLRQKKWEQIELEELQVMTLFDNKFPVQIETGEEVEILFRPIFLNDQFEQSIRIVVTGTLEDQRVGGYLDIQVFPYPSLDFDALSVKEKWSDLQKRAEKWHKDAYLVNVIVHIPIKREPNSHIVALTYQSTESTKEELVLLIDRYGEVAEQFNTYSKEVPREKPLLTEQWSIDTDEILRRLLAYDSSIEVPSDNCNGLELSHNASDELSWFYSESDCGQMINELYQIDPNTGLITPLK